jgi:hypothetical protein
MTAPQEPQEPPQQQPPPTSPQVESTEDALDAAESTIAPVLAALLLAALLMPDGDDSAPAAGNIARGSLFATKHIVKTMAGGVTATARGVLSMALLPLVISRIRLTITSEHLYLMPGQEIDGFNHSGWRLPHVDVEQVARDAVERAIDRAGVALEKAAKAAEPVDIYDRHNGKGTDTRTDSQRQADNFGTATARWITREALFDAQSEIAADIGYTHKRWITVGDSRVRHEHAGLDGRVVPVNSVFVTETGNLRHPGDVAAPLHLTINCRCSLEWLKR